MANPEKQKLAALGKELKKLQARENRLRSAARKPRKESWKESLEARVPRKVYAGLQSTFAKAFSLVFNQGRPIIEKGYDKESLLARQKVRDQAFRDQGKRRLLKQMGKAAGKANTANLVLTTAEGLALGALGIGMPDIVLFISAILRGVYETALHYGYDYIEREEQLLILKLMAAALATGEDWQQRNSEIDRILSGGEQDTSDDAFAAQLHDTASVFAVDMLLMKFVQGLPLVGIVGGAANPVYYRKVLRYVQLKYRKRWLWKISRDLERGGQKGLVPQ